MSKDIKRYIPPGPIGAAFIQSRGPIDIIMGPAGSGKTVASVIKGPLLAASYMPVCKDGVVRVKMICVRDTYRDFARTALASWHEYFPIGHPWQRADKGYEGGQDRPVRHHLEWEAWRGPDKVKIEFTMETGAIGDQNVMQFVRGYEISMAWGNEVDLMDPIVPSALFMRTGRYPPMERINEQELERVSRDGRASMRKIGVEIGDTEPVLPRMFWGDMNPPDIDHPILAACGYADPATKNPAYNFFQQPGGLSDAAENRAGRARSAYEMDLIAMPEHLSRRMVHGLPGYLRDGNPVYPEFNLKRHVADVPIDPIPNIPIEIGVDGGGSPAAAIVQFMANGQARITDELVTEPGTGPARFAEMLVEILLLRYRNTPIRAVWGDPANFYSPDRLAGDLSFMQIVQKAIGVDVTPAPSQEPALRQEAVRWYLGKPIDDATERMLVNPACKSLVGGFAGHYKLTKTATASGTDKLAVVKNRYSHPHDALQYVCLGHRGSYAVIEAAGQLGRPDNVVSLRQRRAQPVQTDRMDFKI